MLYLRVFFNFATHLCLIFFINDVLFIFLYLTLALACWWRLVAFCLNFLAFLFLLKGLWILLWVCQWFLYWRTKQISDCIDLGRCSIDLGSFSEELSKLAFINVERWFVIDLFLPLSQRLYLLRNTSWAAVLRCFFRKSGGKIIFRRHKSIRSFASWHFRAFLAWLLFFAALFFYSARCADID